MSGITNLQQLLADLRPQLMDGEYAFCTVIGDVADYLPLNPLATFYEREGLTLIVPLRNAVQAGMTVETSYRQITLTVHSSLEAVGLTAAVASKLAERQISANVVAAYYHDHIFVPADKAVAALAALQELGSSHAD
ncbi:ACT domain-containing protein [Vibrio sp.]|uniref:ACT domain-containing protein n=1 Tax=Vibrio sp. TaxID=678 RepID=UPI003D0CCB90